MRKLLLICALALTNLLFAKTITVDNNTSTKQVAMFNDLSKAVAFAQAGDIIMIKGSGIEYDGTFTLDKKLIFIGEGYENIGFPHQIFWCKKIRLI